MRYRCERHALPFVEEYTTCLTNLNPCFICGRPASQAYRMIAAPMRRALLRSKLPRPDVGKLFGRLRETRQWTAETGLNHVRLDFAYRDPASGRTRQYAVDVMFPENAGLPEPVIDTMRECVARELQRQCGIDRAIENQRPLSLPRIVPGRFV